MQTLWDITNTTFEQSCRDYDAQNPQVWQMFRDFTLQALGAGRKRIGSRLIIERIRWESIVRAKGDFKINNDMQPYYARKFRKLYPQYKGVFEIRKGRM